MTRIGISGLRAGMRAGIGARKARGALIGRARSTAQEMFCDITEPIRPRLPPAALQYIFGGT